MTAEAGLGALWFAGAMAGLQLVVAILALVRPGGANEDALIASVRPVAILQGLLVLIAMGCLIEVFLDSDMTVRLVGENSHSAKPWLYKFAGAWGNHEGSMLLWVTILGIAGGAVAILEHRLPPRTLVATLGAQAVIALGFYAFLLFASNPFARGLAGPGRRAGAEPAAPGPRLGVPSTDAVYRLCRAVGRLLVRGRGAGDARCRPGVRAGDAAMGAGSMDLPDAGDHRGVLLGLLRSRLGRLVVLGPGRERVADAVARGDRAAPFGDGAGDARRVARVDGDAGGRRCSRCR